MRGHDRLRGELHRGLGGGQYAQAKHILGPLAAFNIALFIIFEYCMLAAGDSLVIGALVNSLNPALSPTPFVVLTIAFLAWLNYRGVHTTLTFNFIITAHRVRHDPRADRGRRVLEPG